MYKCIVTITERGLGDDVVIRTRALGAFGGTIISGKGSSLPERNKWLAMIIKPEKDIVLTVVKEALVQPILDDLTQRFRLNDLGKGISFVLPIENVVGVDLALEEPVNET
jgi:nitrogen regulatory protein PII